MFGSAQGPPLTVRERLGPLLRSPAFLMVCVLSLFCTIVRETFNDWTPVYMRDFVHLSMSDAAGLSAIFPGVGAVSVLVTGWLGDRLGPNGRPQILFVGLTATAVALSFLTMIHRGGTTRRVADRPDRGCRLLSARAIRLPRWRHGVGFWR